MPSQRKIILALALLAGALVAWLAYGAHEKRAQAREIAALVEQGAGQLAAALEKTPSPEQVAAARRTEDALAGARTSRQKEMAQAAGQYLAATRVLVQRRADLPKLQQQAVDSRQALAAHMGASAHRNAGWIQRAAELKRNADLDQGELERATEAIADVLRSLEDSKAALAPHLESARR